MAYLVLARKYRPTRFADIIGQEHIVRTLGNAIAMNRVHHAFLFTGARGVGKTTTARVLARTLNCKNGPTLETCGTCASCVEIGQGSCPDVLEIDGASNTGVDNVRELRENVRYLPSHSRFKIYIIDEVHMLSQAAFNALLKTLEEPPAHVKFIFATTEPHKIPVTILSRCQRFDFRRVSSPLLAQHLRTIVEREGLTLGVTALSAVAREAQGSVRDALSLLDQVLSYAGPELNDQAIQEALGLIDRQAIFALTEAIFSKDANQILALVQTIDARGHELATVASLLLEHFRHVMVAKLVQNLSESLLDASPAEIEALRAQAALVETADLHRYFAVLVTVAEDVSRSLQPRITLEMGLLRLLEIESSTSLASLIERLDGLAQQGPVEAKAPVKVPAIVVPEVESKPPPRVADVDATVDIHGKWREVVDKVRLKRPGVASLWEHAKLIKLANQTLELGFDKKSFYLESARDASNRMPLQEVLDDVLGASITISLQALEGESLVDTSLRSLAELSDHQKDLRLQQVHDGALQHPAVREVLQVLGGQVKEVVPL